MSVLDQVQKPRSTTGSPHVSSCTIIMMIMIGVIMATELLKMTWHVDYP